MKNLWPSFVYMLSLTLVATGVVGYLFIHIFLNGMVVFGNFQIAHVVCSALFALICAFTYLSTLWVQIFIPLYYKEGKY